MKASKKDLDFLNAVKAAKVGDEIETDDGSLLVESIFDVPTHFAFHQRIFEAGVILKKTGDSNVRIHIPADLIGMKVNSTDKSTFVDKQKDKDGKVLPADRGILRNPEKLAKLASAQTKN